MPQQPQQPSFGAQPASNPFAMMGQGAMSPPQMMPQQQPMGFGMGAPQSNPFASSQPQNAFGQMNMGMANMNLSSNPFGGVAQVQQPQQHSMVSIDQNVTLKPT